jgi:hypothetical protein
MKLPTLDSANLGPIFPGHTGSANVSGLCGSNISLDQNAVNNVSEPVLVILCAHMVGMSIDVGRLTRQHGKTFNLTPMKMIAATDSRKGR